MSTTLVRYSEIMPFEVRQSVIEAAKASAAYAASRMLKQTQDGLAERIAERLDGKAKDLLGRSVQWLIIARRNGRMPEYQNA